MKHTICWALALAAGIFTSSVVQAEDTEKAWAVDTSVGAFTDYMFRGKNVYDGISIQPTVSALYSFGEWGTLSGNVWSHIPGETREPPEKFTEVDYTTAYDIKLLDSGDMSLIDAFTLTGGHIFYTFSGDDARIEDTEEYFVSARADFSEWEGVGTFYSSFTFYNDYNKGKYQYYSAKLGGDITFAVEDDQLTLLPYVLFGFAGNATDGPIFYEENGLEHIDIGTSTIFTIGPVYLEPTFNFTFKIDDFANNQFWFGVLLGTGF